VAGDHICGRARSIRAIFLQPVLWTTVRHHAAAFSPQPLWPRSPPRALCPPVGRPNGPTAWWNPPLGQYHFGAWHKARL